MHSRQFQEPKCSPGYNADDGQSYSETDISRVATCNGAQLRPIGLRLGQDQEVNGVDGISVRRHGPDGTAFPGGGRRRSAAINKPTQPKHQAAANSRTESLTPP